MPTRALATFLALAVGAATVPCRAQTDENRASARAIAAQAVKAMSEKRWSDAVDLLNRAESLVHAPTFLLYLGRSYAQLGKLVEAHEAYTRLMRESLPPGAPKAFLAAQADGGKELEALEPRLPSLTIQVTGGTPSDAVTVTMDGAPLPAALVGVAHPVNPGEHKLQATTTGSASGVIPVVVKESAVQTVTLSLQPTAGAPPVEPPIAPPLTPSLPPPMRTEPGPFAPPVEHVASASSGLRTTGYVTGAVGVVGVALGTTFALVSHGKVSDSKALCPGDVCTASSASQASTLRSQVDSLNGQATTFADLSVTGFVVGGVALAAAVTLVLLGSSGHSSSEPSSSGVGVWIGPGSSGLVGRF